MTATDLEYSLLSLAVYNKTVTQEELAGWTLVSPLTLAQNLIPNADSLPFSDESGFYAEAYERNGEYVISFRGVDTSSAGDFLTDLIDALNLGLSDVPDQYLAAFFFVEAVKTKLR